MKHETVLKRDDGSKAVIYTAIRAISHSDDVVFNQEVWTAEKGKRKLKPSFSTDDYTWRRLSREEKAIFEMNSMLEHVTKIELHQAKLELWEKIKPTFI